MTNISKAPDHETPPPDPEDRLLLAISTLQAISLAQTSLANGADKWGIYYTTTALDETIAILIGLLDHLGNPTPISHK
jgi:hypothetical protein